MNFKKIKIAPSILSADFANLGKDVKRAEEAGADMLHVDVMDGHFVPNISIGPLVVKAIRGVVDIEFDVHLMISEPQKYIKSFADSGADIITIHVQCDSPVAETLDLIRSYGKKVGLALNPDVPFARIKPFLNRVDMVLFMSVFPGFGGQKFMAEVLPGLTECRKYLDENGLGAVDIQIDGGIDFETSKVAIEAGANILVSGTTIYKHPSMSEAILKLRNAAN